MALRMFPNTRGVLDQWIAANKIQGLGTQANAMGMGAQMAQGRGQTYAGQEQSFEDRRAARHQNSLNTGMAGLTNWMNARMFDREMGLRESQADNPFAGMGGAGGSLLGMGVGALVGGAPGAMIGGGIGGSVGSMVDSAAGTGMATAAPAQSAMQMWMDYDQGNRILDYLKQGSGGYNANSPSPFGFEPVPLPGPALGPWPSQPQ